MNNFSDPEQHPVAHFLPRFTFITGPNGVGKTTLARQLFDNVKGLQTFSFAEPLREAIRGMFWQGDINLDLQDELIKTAPVPGVPNRVHREVLNGIGDWARDFFGPDILGRIALHRCEVDAEYFEHFVFDDARRLTDVMPIVEKHGAQNTLLISLSRPGVTFEQPHHFVHDEELQMVCPTIAYVNDKPISNYLDDFTLHLKRWRNLNALLPSQPETANEQNPTASQPSS